MRSFIRWSTAAGLAVALAVAVTGQPAADPRVADAAGLKATAASLREAFAARDPAALAARFTADGETHTEGEDPVRGRDAITKLFADFFRDNPKAALTSTPESVRFLGKDLAVVVGRFRMTPEPGAEPVPSRYEFLFTREAGHWLIAAAREWPDEPTVTPVSLADVNWLVGEWAAKSGTKEVRTKFTLEGNKKFIRGQFTISEDGQPTVNGTQVITFDAAQGVIRSWLFEDTGTFGESTWHKVGKHWENEAIGVTPDGTTVTALNVLTPVDADHFTWQSVRRAADGEPLPDDAPVKVARVKNR